MGELLGLQYHDLIGDKRERVLLVRRQWTKDGRVETPKTKKADRRVPLPEDLALKIRKRKLERGAGDEDFVFASPYTGRPPTPGNWRRRGWNEAVKAAKLTDGPRITPHDARHAFVSQAAELGLSSDDVAEIVGHTSSKVTEEIYRHAFNRDEREQRQREVMARMAGASR